MIQNCLRVLIVDDEISIREPLKTNLVERFNFHVDLAANGREAWQQITAGSDRYDVVVIDQLLMPGADGIEVMREIRRSYPDIECVIMTGWGLEAKQKALEAGAFRYIEKPPDLDELAMIIRMAAQQVLMREINRSILTHASTHRTLEEICKATRALTNADAALIALYETSTQAYTWYPKSRHAASPKLRTQIDEALTRQVLESGKAIIQAEMTTSPLPLSRSPGQKFHCYAAAPIPGTGGNLGVLYALSRRKDHFSSGGYLALLQTMAGQAGLAITSAQSFQAIRQHAAYMQALVKAGQELSRKTILEDQLSVAWDFVSRQLGGSTFFIALHNAQKNLLEFPLFYDNGQRVYHDPLVVSSGTDNLGICGYILKTGQELSWLTLRAKQEFLSNLGIAPRLLGDPCKTCIFLPLRVGPRILGVISIQSYEENAFSPILLNAFRSLGSHLVVALENSRILEELRSAYQNLDALNRVALNISEATDQEALLKKIISQANTLTGAEGGSIFLLDPDENHLRLAAALDDNDHHPLPQIRALTREILKTGRPKVFPKKHPRREMPDHHAGLPWVALGGAPIRASQTLLGALVVHNTGPDSSFGQEKLALLQKFADHAGLALQKIQIYETLKKIHQVSAEITASLDLSEVIHRTCQSVVDIFKMDHSAMVVFDKDYRNGKVEGEFPVGTGLKGMYLTLSEIPFEADLLQRMEPLIYPNLQHVGSALGHLQQVWTEKGISSVAIIPVIYQEEVIGSFSLETLQRYHNFSPEEIELARVFAAHVAVAVENARLVHDLERKDRLLASLVEASYQLRAEREAPKLLNEVLRQAVLLMDGQAGVLCAHLPSTGQLEILADFGLPEELIQKRYVSNRYPPVEDILSCEKRVTQGISGTLAPELSTPDLDFQRWISVSLRNDERANLLLVIFDRLHFEPYARLDEEILERFGLQTEIVLHSSQLISSEHRYLDQFQLLHTILDYILTEQDLKKIEHMMLTGVTAGKYGLEFNRAALFLVDWEQNLLTGKLGIGHWDVKAAEKDWKLDMREGRQSWPAYKNLLESGQIDSTPLNGRIQGLSINLATDSSAYLTGLLKNEECVELDQEEIEQLPLELLESFEPGAPAIVVPLSARGQAIGLLIADNKFSRIPITDTTLKALLTFTRAAALAYDNLRLIDAARRERDRLHHFFEASNALVLSEKEQEVLENIVRRAYLSAGAMEATIISIEPSGEVRTLISAGEEQNDYVIGAIRDQGISRKVWRNGSPEIIEDVRKRRDEVNEGLLRRNVGAAVCLPMSFRNEQLGVMWFHFSRPRRFSEGEIEAMRLFVNQAAIGYEGTRQLQELERLRKAAEELAAVQEAQEVLNRIAKLACFVLDADQAAVWTYDAPRGRLISGRAGAFNIPETYWETLRTEKTVGSTTRRVLAEDWVGVKDTSDDQFMEFAGETTRSTLKQMGVKSFQALTLKVAGDTLGVLFVNYIRRRDFRESDIELARAFSNHAALAMQTARLVDQLARARESARVVSKLTISGDLNATLDTLVEETRNTLDCDPVILYTYDAEQQRLNYPPKMTDVDFPERVTEFPYISQGSIINKVLTQNSIEYVEDARNHPDYRERRFTLEEGVQSVVCIHLKAQGQTVGVMFINYHSLQHFTRDMRSTIELIANQAAAAIHQAQLFHREQRYRLTLEAIQKTTAEVSAVLELEAILPVIAERTAQIFSQPAVSIMLWDAVGENLVISNAFGLGHHYLNDQKISRKTVDHLRSTQGLGPHIFDLNEQPLGDRDLIRAEGLKKVLVAPLTAEGTLIGILNIYTRDESTRFTEMDKKLALTLASNTAIAIHNAQAYRNLEETKDLLAARTQLAWVGMVTSTWYHAVNNHARTIKEQLQKLRSQNPGALSQLVKGDFRFGIIEDLANRILEKPITPPLSSEERVDPFSLNDLVKVRVERLSSQEPFNATSIRMNLDWEREGLVRASPEWLRRAFDIILENAAKVLIGRRDGRITVSTIFENRRALLSIADNGPGFPPEIVEIAFKKPVPKKGQESGLGLGLLFAQMIVQTYGGEIKIVQNSPEGAVVTLSLPAEG